MSSAPRAPLSDSARTAEEIDAAREIHQDLAIEWAAASSYTIPGMSARPDSCGNWYPYHVCDECGQPIFSESHCGLRKCPECWYQWIRDTAEKIVIRLQAYRWAQDDGLDRRLIHGLFSPEQDENWTVSRVDRIRKDSYEKADDAGITGGCALLHLWRTTDDLDEEFRAATAAGVADKKWKYIRETYGKGWRRAVEVSPHVHQIAVAPEFEPERDSWVAKRVRTLDSMKSLSHPSSYEDVAGLAMYLLSHTAIADGEQALRWFGDVYPGGFNPEEELSSGALDTIERMAAEAVEPDGEDEDDDVDQLPEELECEAGTEGCPGQPMPIWDVPSARRRNWWDDLDRGVEKKLSVACEWMMGDLDPPPARSEQEARELLEKMVEM
jgi:hypothetical protein